MALAPKISICIKNSCKQLVLTDTTGLYNVTTNPTGWNTPNLNLVDVISAIVSVTIPDTTTPVDIDVTSTVIAATIIDGEFQLDILTMESDFGGDEDQAFPDGVYDVTYTISSNVTEYIYSIRTFSTCNVACCLEKMKTKFEEEMCGCNWESYFMNYLKAKAILDGAKRAFACGDTDKAENMLEAVQKICKNSKCNC